MILRNAAKANAHREPPLTESLAPLPPRHWQAMPKVLLHEHLDGGLRPQTLLDLCRATGLSVPAGDAPSLAAWMQANADA